MAPRKASSKKKSVIPEGHTFVGPGIFVSSKAADILEDLLEKAENRNPDEFNMYIYENYYSHAILDLVDSVLAKIHYKILKKSLDEAMYLLEALSVFQEMEPTWPMCDDKNRSQISNMVYGALLVTVIRKLKQLGRLDIAHFPSLETTLKYGTYTGEGLEDSYGGSYHLVCKAIGKRLFGKKSKRTVALEKARLEEWIASLDKENQKEVREDMKEKTEEQGGQGHVEEPWYDGAKDYDEDAKDRSFALSRVWKEYKEFLKSTLTVPVRGPPIWDLTEWTAEERRVWEFRKLDDDVRMF